MLIGISALISPDLLSVLCRLGHTQEIAFIDANCPVPSGHPCVLRADGISLLPLLEGVLAVLPIDTATEKAIFRSSYNNDPRAMIPVYEEVVALCSRMVPEKAVHPLVNAAFGESLRNAAAIVVTGERRLYANVILRKGVIEP